METKEQLILDSEFIQFCKINKIDDVQKLAKEVFNKGFMLLKYGDKPNLTNNEVLKTKTNEVKNTIKKENKNDNLYEE